MAKKTIHQKSPNNQTINKIKRNLCDINDLISSEVIRNVKLLIKLSILVMIFMTAIGIYGFNLRDIAIAYIIIDSIASKRI